MPFLPTIAYAGMTHLGLCSAIAAASKGFPTLGFSQDAALITALSAGNLPVVEPELDDLLATNHERLSFTTDPTRLTTADVVYVAPDVPTDDQGISDLQPLDQLLECVLTHTRSDAVIVVLSQVPPGYTRARQRPERVLYYQVETLIFGRAVERATKPERFIVGCADPLAPIPHSYNAYLQEFGCPILPMRYESAELCKIAINCCLVASVSVANTLAELCEGIGADWHDIVPALKLDRRIGPYSYLAPGLGLSGGNLERDLATVLRFSEHLGTDAGVVSAWLANSTHRKGWSAQTIKTELLDRNPRARVAVLGLAYKENTRSIKNSPSIACLNALRDHTLAVYDPVVTSDVVPFAEGSESALECAAGADCLVILTPWPEFRGIDPLALARVMKGRIIIDPYRCIDQAAAIDAGFDYITLGIPPVRAKRA